MRNGAWSSRRHAKKDFLLEIRRACRHEPAVTRKNKAVSGGFSEQDDSASGFAWVAREPQLMYGAMGRASSQRSVEYHIQSPFTSLNARGSSVSSGVFWSLARQICLTNAPALFNLTL
jgi:hypothetical protein